MIGTPDTTIETTTVMQEYLAEIYRMTGNLKRAESVLSEILMISPEEEKAKDLLSRLDLAFNESEYSF
ncbi:MAG TPA: hypothetical protein PK683_15430 [Leptospiraceae bacterium]|nr:hypothetical protein [Leptospiraceae bacterium]